jgi:hypothetical protein
MSRVVLSSDEALLLDEVRTTQKGVKLASHAVQGYMRCLASYERYIHSANSNKIHTKPTLRRTEQLQRVFQLLNSCINVIKGQRRDCPASMLLCHLHRIIIYPVGWLRGHIWCRHGRRVSSRGRSSWWSSWGWKMRTGVVGGVVERNRVYGWVVRWWGE